MDPLALAIESTLSVSNAVVGPGGVTALVKLEEENDDSVPQLRERIQELLREKENLTRERDVLSRKVVKLESQQASDISQVKSHMTSDSKIHDPFSQILNNHQNTSKAALHELSYQLKTATIDAVKREMANVRGNDIRFI